MNRLFSLAAAVSLALAGGLAFAQTAAPPKSAGDKPAAAKKATNKSAPVAKRLDFAPATPIAATPAAPKALPGAGSIKDKSESHCHSSSNSDA